MAKKAEERREKLSIYLAKDAAAPDSKLLELEKTTETPTELVAENCRITLYGKRYVPADYPKWSEFLTTTNLKSLDGIIEKTNSTGAILIVRTHKRTFIITFGTSSHIILDDAIERDFGLRVTLNSVDPKKLRSLDKASYSSNPLNSRNQSPIDADIFDLTVDSESDLIYALTGVSKFELFGPQVTGRDALVVNPYVELNSLHEVLRLALEQYGKALPPEFEWFDNIKKVRDEQDIQKMDLELDKYLSGKKTGAHIWLGEPEIVDWEHHIGYSFDLMPKTDRHVLLELDDLEDYLDRKSVALTCANIRNVSVHANDDKFQSSKIWSAYRCLYAEITMGTETCILRNGIWYRVNKDYVHEVNSSLLKLKMYSVPLPNYNHESEGEYNSWLAGTDRSFVLMDKKNIQFGGRYSKVEFCDLIKDKTHLIHVKCYRSSTSLSHLFSQGLVSAEVFVSDPEFRKKLNSKLPGSVKLSNADARPDAVKYTVVYAIATNKGSIGELPFFSKVTLKNCAKRLGGLGFKVNWAFIDVEDAILAKKRCKPAKAKGAGLKKRRA